MNFNKKNISAENYGRNLNSEKTFLYFFIVLIFFLLIGSSNKFPGLTYSPTGAAISTKILQNTNYMVGFMVFAFLLVALFLAFSLLKKEKRKKQQLELPEENIPLATLNKRKPLHENLDQVNLELKNLRKEKKELIKKNKLVSLPNPDKIKLSQAANEENYFLQSSDKPVIMEVPQDKNKLDQDLAKVEKEIDQLDQLEFKKVKILDEIPPMPLGTNSIEKIKLQKELKKIIAALFERKER
ncbi:MAG: hypothetical protein AABW48_04385 [Nanoarchaeota archaeon]